MNLQTIALGLALATNEVEGPVALDAHSATLQALDTLTGRTRNLVVETGGSASFGRLNVHLRKCRYMPENPSTQSYAFLTVEELPERSVIFNAWMIASAPALSAMDHPRYDIWLIRCNARDVSPQNE